MTLGTLLRRASRTLSKALSPGRHLQASSCRSQEFDTDLPTAILVGFARWKTFMPEYLRGHNVVFAGHSANISTEDIMAIPTFDRPEVFTWSYKAPSDLCLFCLRHGIPLTYVEDGFIRSFGLGAERSSPLSLVFDRQAMHFDRLRPSELEVLLETYEFDQDCELMEQAARLANLMRLKGLSKYNFPTTRGPIAGVPGGRQRILVLGQVEDDLSIRYGADTTISGNELVMLAANENPSAQILYRPHPESVAFSKPHYSNPSLVADICQIVGSEYALSECLDQCEHVYTITSLAGFEAALRGKHVVTLGAPFYSGWGFTEDRLPLPRRSRRLTPEQVLAGAYLKYPRYAGISGAQSPRQIVERIEKFALALG